MSRRAARMHAFFLIFQMEFHVDFDPSESYGLHINNIESVAEEAGIYGEDDLSKDDLGFIYKELRGVHGNAAYIDKKIAEYLSGWEIDRINKVDLALIRLAAYEMFFEDKIPPNVSINEAVELAKAYGSDDSYQFVNGILASFYKFGPRSDG